MNIVLILTDDQRWDTFDQTHGLGGLPVMPILKAELMDSGVTFVNGCVTTALCCPSRASILTGKYAHNHGVLRNGPPDGGAGDFDDAVTLATLLQEAGYRTALIGKYMNGYELLSPYIPPGWDEWRAFIDPGYFNYDLNENGVIGHYGVTIADYSTDVLLSKSLDFIDSSVAQSVPFLLYLAPAAPHFPFTPAPRHVGQYAGVAPWRPPNYNERNVGDKPPWVQSLAKLSAAAQVEIDAERKLYLASLQAVDEAVGALMQRLRDHVIADDTLVVFMGDNSYLWGEHRLTKKQAPYDEAMRVPLVVRYPPLAPTARQDSSFALNVDLLPTLLELAGVPVPAGVNGSSLLTLLPGNPPAWRTDFLNEHWAAGALIPDFSLVRNEQYKYVEYLPSSGQGTELYDLLADPYELVNRTNDALLDPIKAELAARLQQLKAD